MGTKWFLLSSQMTMGCWNESCMVTGLPILYQQECAVVLLAEPHHKNRSGHVSSAYCPIFIITGHYNDYGGLEPDPKNEPKLELLQKALHQKKTSQSITEWFNQLIHNETAMPTKPCALNKTDTRSISVQAVFLHKEVLDMAHKNTQGYPSITPLLEEILNTKEAKQRAKKENDFNTEERMDLKLSELIIRILELDAVVNWPAQAIISKLITHDTIITLQMLKQIVELNILLEDLRKAWHIPSGSGSQESIEPAQKLFLKVYEHLLNTITINEGFE